MSFCLKRAFLPPRQNDRRAFPTLTLHVHPTVMYIRLENKSSDGLFHQRFCEWKNLYSSCQEMIYANRKMNGQKMNEIVNARQYGSLNFIKTSPWLGCLGKSICQLMRLSNCGKSIWKPFDQIGTKYWRDKQTWLMYLGQLSTWYF